MSQVSRISHKSQARARRRQLRVWWAVGVIIVLGASAAWWVASARPQGPPPPWLGAQIPDEGREHVPVGSSIPYRAHPPSSGPHYPAPAPTGVYPDGLLTGFWVHSLEHGYIVLAVKPPIPQSLLPVFNTMVTDFPKSKFGSVKLVIVPYDEMLHPFAVLAWDWRLVMDTFDRDTVLHFYRAHVDRGPEDIP
jgi:Protein of unknown function (DUF3105)